MAAGVTGGLAVLCTMGCGVASFACSCPAGLGSLCSLEGEDTLACRSTPVPEHVLGPWEGRGQAVAWSGRMQSGQLGKGVTWVAAELSARNVSGMAPGSQRNDCHHTGCMRRQAAFALGGSTAARMWARGRVRTCQRQSGRSPHGTSRGLYLGLVSGKPSHAAVCRGGVRHYLASTLPEACPGAVRELLSMAKSGT